MNSKGKTMEFLAAAIQVSRGRSRIFRMQEACAYLKWSRTECDEMANRLEKEGLINRLPTDEAILTTAGRAIAGDEASG
jgi:Mn-dependent DtxR family transcriptional regulator